MGEGLVVEEVVGLELAVLRMERIFAAAPVAVALRACLHRQKRETAEDFLSFRKLVADLFSRTGWKDFHDSHLRRIRVSYEQEQGLEQEFEAVLSQEADLQPAQLFEIGQALARQVVP